MLDAIYFARLERLIYVPVFIVAAILFVRNYYRIKVLSCVLVSTKNIKNVFPNFSLTKARLKLILMLFALMTLFVAMLRPQWGETEHHVIQEGRDLLIVFDVSRSMLAKDMKPNRLEFAKLKVRKLLERLSFERVGLILFSGSSFVSCPFTSDYSAFLMFLKQIDSEVISSGTTALDAALIKAINVYSSQSYRKNKLVLLVTDGEDFSSHLNVAKKKTKELGIKIFALGVGSDKGAPIPVIDAHGQQTGHEIDKDGKPAISLLNEKLLSEMANELNGKYFRATYDNSDIEGIVENIEQFEKEKFEDKSLKQLEDRYPWFLGASFFFLLLEWII